MTMNMMFTSYAFMGKPEKNKESVIYRMPSSALRTVKENSFFLDPRPFLIYDSAYMDLGTYERLMNNPHQSFNQVSKFVKLLKEDGILKLIDYREIIKKDGNLFKLSRMTNNDMEYPDRIIDLRINNINKWSAFLHNSRNKLYWEKGLLDPRTISSPNLIALQDNHASYPGEVFSLKKYRRIEDIGSELLRQAVKRVIRSYSEHINGTILVARYLRADIIDWDDFLPIYEERIGSVGGDSKTRSRLNVISSYFSRHLSGGVDSIMSLIRNRGVASMRDEIHDGVRMTDTRFHKILNKYAQNIPEKPTRKRKIYSAIKPANDEALFSLSKETRDILYE